MIVVAAVFMALAAVLGRERAPEQASDVDTALVIDLPPAMASSIGTREAAEGPPRTPAQATTTAAAEPEETPQRPERAKPPDPPTQTEAPSSAPPPKAADAPASTVREEHAPLGSQSPVPNDSDAEDPQRPHASAHAITRWQLSLMRRLQQVKRAFVREERWSGTVRIAFEIDDRGALVNERIAQSSGSTALDQAATILVKEAAPFPPPPPGAGPGATSFIVPIVFRR